MKKIHIGIGIFLGICAIVGTAYSGFKFYSCKADKVDVNRATVLLTQTKADRTELELVKNDFYIYKLQERRKYVQQRIWDIQREFPQMYQNNQEWRRLMQELQQIDVQINAYYQKGGK